MCASETSTRSCQSAIVAGSPDCSATTRGRARVGERGVGVEAVLGLAVEDAERLEVRQVLDAGVEHVLGEHPELRAPVAEVVVPDHACGPANSSARTSASPMTVVRRCPTCISLATLGAE